MTAGRFLDRRARPLPEPARRAVLTIAIVGLSIAMVWAWRRSALRLDDLRWWPLAALAAVAAPLSLVLKAAEFTVASRVVGQRPSRARALEVAMVSSAANLLPVPGSLLVTVQTIAAEGAGYGGAARASAVPGIAWLGVTGVAGGAAIALVGPLSVGLASIGAGVVALVASWLVLRSVTAASERVALAAAVLVVESAWLAVSGLRFTLAAAVLGVDLELGQAIALSVAGAVTAAIGFVPGGLGVREALIAALSPVIGLDVETGVLLGAVDRVVWLGFLALGTAVFGVRRTSGLRGSSDPR